MRKALCIMASFLLLLSLAACGGDSYEHIFGDLEWYSTFKADSDQKELKLIKDSYYYSDGWFETDPSKENQELALASIQLAASATDGDEDGPGTAFLKSMGFEEVGFSDFDMKGEFDCNYTFARKSLGDTELVAVIFQSTSEDPKVKNAGWKQNFMLNEPDVADPSGEHYAYSKVVESVIEEIAALAKTENTKFWITGESRGGALANVLAAHLPEKNISDKNIYAYTFESPATTDAADAEGGYKYIHNYVCSDDIVTKIPMWGMTRYGQQHELRTEETDEGLEEALRALGSDAADLRARIVTEDASAQIAENFEKKIPSRADYTKEISDKWTDADGNAHELSYTYQDAFVKLMDLVFRADSDASVVDGLASKKDDLEGCIGHLKEGVKLESSGNEPSAEYWEGSKGMYAVLKEINEGELPMNEEDIYKVVRVIAPVLITIPEDGGEPDTELLTDVIAYNKELTYSHTFDTLIARLKILAPKPEK